VASPIEQATIGRTLVIKGEVTGSESLYVDGRIEGHYQLQRSSRDRRPERRGPLTLPRVKL